MKLSVRDKYIIYNAFENPDWDFARTLRATLRCSGGEFTASIYSVPFIWNNMIFYMPNRDIPYEGLLISGTNTCYKLIDGIGFSINRKLSPVKTYVSLDEIIYLYKSDNAKFSVHYKMYAFDNEIKLNIKLDTNLHDKVYMIMLLDMRPYKHDINEKYNITMSKNILKVSRKNMVIQIPAIDEFIQKNGFIEWIYKIDDGYRHIENGLIKFNRTSRKLYIPGIIGLGRKPSKVVIKCSTTDLPPRMSSDLYEFSFNNNVIDFLIRSRIKALSTFGQSISLNGDVLWVPEAGGWWFREVWSRDMLEGILWNVNTYLYVLKWFHRIRKLLKFFLEKMVFQSYMHTKPFNRGDEYSSDAVPLLFIVASKYALMKGDIDIAEKCLRKLSYVLKKLRENFLDEKNGPPVYRNGLIYSVPNHSWTDSRIWYKKYIVPSRIPVKILDQLYEYKGEGFYEEIYKPKYLLPEINALWIKALSNCVKMAELLNISYDREIKIFLDRMSRRFKQVFIKENKVLSLIYPFKNLIDTATSSMGMVSIALTSFLFDMDELLNLWKSFKKILVYRRLVLLGNSDQKLFGIYVRDYNEQPFLDDRQYHGYVCWPRDTPYLIAFLEKILKKNLIKELLINHLDHMISEATIFYENELFSSPIGGNPSPTENSSNPIPVKNQIQYWSHWCDPYLRYIDLLMG